MENSEKQNSGASGFFKSKCFIILQATLLVVFIVAFVVLLLVGADSCGDGEDRDDDVSADSSQEISDNELYNRFLSDKKSQVGYAETFEITDSYDYFREWTPSVTGIVSACIGDLNSDDTEEMVLVTAQDVKLNVSVYTIEDDQVTLVKSLFDDVRFRCEENFAVYIKHHNDSSYIVLDYDIYPGGTGSSTAGSSYKVYELNSNGTIVCRMDYAFNRRPYGYVCYTNFTEVLYEYDGETDTVSGKFDDEKLLDEHIEKEKSKFGLVPGSCSEQSDVDPVSVIDWKYSESGDLTLTFTDHTDISEKEITATESVSPEGSSENVSLDFSAQEAKLDLDTVKWLLEPNIKADDINVLRCDRYDTVNGIEDYNSSGKHKYDLISVYKRHGKLGLISYSGGEVVGSEYDSITIGYGQRYALERYDDEQGYLTYTLSELHEQVKIADIADIIGTMENDTPVWCDSYGLISRLDCREIPVKSGINSVVAALYVPDSAVSIEDGSIYNINISNASGYVLVRNGERISDTVYEDAGSFSCGIIPVKKNGKWGYVDEHDNLVLPFEYEACWSSLERVGNGVKWAYNASDDYVVVGKGGQYALYDVDGKLIIDFGTFECIRPVYEGMCWVRSNGLWGVIAVEEDAGPEPYVEADIYFDARERTVKSSNGVRMRNGPETHYRVVSILSNRAKVMVVGQTVDGVWSLVQHENVYGWVKTEYLK